MAPSVTQRSARETGVSVSSEAGDAALRLDPTRKRNAHANEKLDFRTLILLHVTPHSPAIQVDLFRFKASIRESSVENHSVFSPHGRTATTCAKGQVPRPSLYGFQETDRWSSVTALARFLLTCSRAFDDCKGMASVNLPPLPIRGLPCKGFRSARSVAAQRI
jgi:hypothetical protein